jgi:FtsP/CotA-like multicopper oxidase with cupredoxin domain
MRLSRRAKILAAVAATVAVLGPVAWFWHSSLLPDAYSVTDMGYHDRGGGPDHDASTAPQAVDALTVPDGLEADVRVTLTAERREFTLASGRRVDGYTLNGSSPGPEIRAEHGQLIEVRLLNESVPDGVTLHWHGVDVPGAMDGAAGVTQDAVGPGGEFVYRFFADQVGTFWYHSHQVSHEQVRGGLLGPLVITPASGPPADVDAVALVHHYDGRRTVNGREGVDRVAAAPGDTVRVRIVNTDFEVMRVWVDGARFRVAAVDGTGLHEPAEVEDVTVMVAAGGRNDLEFTVPARGPVRVNLGATAALLVGDGTTAASERPQEVLDLLHYGSPRAIGFDPGAPDREFAFGIGRRPGFLDGRPGVWWTVNGGLFPDVPMFTVAYGDIVRMRITNDSGESHPMHLHGHHAVVLSRDGVAATGSPWWIDSLEVGDGETYEIAFEADNPGIWMDHCHNLPHAAEGLVAHLVYEGITEPFLIGGDAHNHPE